MQDIKIPDSHEEEIPHEPSEAVKMKFSKFVQLMASHNFDEVMQAHADEDIVVSTNLLADIASCHEELKQDDSRKLPLMLLVGIIIGIVITYLVIQL